MARIETARIRQNPKAGSAKTLWLWAKGGTRPRKRNSVGHYPKNRDPSWSISPNLALQSTRTSDQLSLIQLTGLSSRTSDDVSQAVPQGQQHLAL